MKLKSLPQLLLGGAIVFVGVGFLLDGLNVWDFGEFFAQWWPSLIIIAGVVSLLTNPSSPLWPVFIAGAGTLLLLRNLDVVDFNVWSVIWPVGVIVVGLSFFFDMFKPKAGKVSEDELNLAVAFSGIESNVSSNDFKGGKLSAVFGGMELDLSDASMDKDATLDIFTAFGGVELRVPSDWNVKASGLPLFGGWENKTKKPSSKNAPTLEVRGTCIFGGVEIKN